MKKEQLIMQLSKYGFVQICKADYVFTLLMTGGGLSKMETYNKIQELCLKFTRDKYPVVEAMRNDDTFFCMILKPTQP